MIPLIVLSILLVLSVILLASYIIFVKSLNTEKFKDFCNRKIERISSRNNNKFLGNINLYNFAQEKIRIDSIIFGKKFIYLISNHCLIGTVEGGENDNSWIYYDRHNKSQEYIENLIDVGNKNIREIARILAINSEFLVSIALIPNECNFSVKSSQEKQNFVTSYSKLSSKISEYESKSVGAFKLDQINEKISLLEKKNEEQKNS